MSDNKFEEEKRNLTPETGFNLVGIDYFGDTENQLYVIEHFDMYQDALNAKKDRKNHFKIEHDYIFNIAMMLQ